MGLAAVTYSIIKEHHFVFRGPNYPFPPLHEKRIMV